MAAYRQDPRTGKMTGSTAGLTGTPATPADAPVPFPPGASARIRHQQAPNPSGCRWCGHDQRNHGQSYTRGRGLHGWEPPTSAQRLARMLARRARQLLDE